MSSKYGRYFLAFEDENDLPPEDLPPIDDAGEDIPPEGSEEQPPMDNEEEEEINIPDSREEEYIDDQGVPHNLKIIDIKPRNYHFFTVPEDAPDEEMLEPTDDSDGGQSLLNPDGTPIEEPMDDIQYDADGNPIPPEEQNPEDEPPMDNNPDEIPQEEPQMDVDGNPIPPEDSSPEELAPLDDSEEPMPPENSMDGDLPPEENMDEPPMDDETLTANPNGMENPPEEPYNPPVPPAENPMDTSVDNSMGGMNQQPTNPNMDMNIQANPIDQPMGQPNVDPLTGQPTNPMDPMNPSQAPTNPSMDMSMGQPAQQPGVDPLTGQPTNPMDTSMTPGMDGTTPPATNPDGTPMLNPDGTPMSQPTGDMSVDDGPVLDDMGNDFSPDADSENPDGGADVNGDMSGDMGGDTPPEDGGDAGADGAPAAPPGPGLEYDSTRKYTLFKNFMSLSNAIDNYISKLELKMGDDANKTAVLKNATDKLREINDLCYDYITLKFEISSYVQSLLFFQKLVVMIQMVFEMVSETSKTLKKHEPQKKQ